MFSPAVDRVFGNIEVLSNLLNIYPRLGTHQANLVSGVDITRLKSAKAYQSRS